MAQKVEWSDSYLLGISEIDEQHKKLIAIANEFYNVVVSSADVYKAKMPAILAKLKDYTILHFHDEEEYMKSVDYEGLQAQIYAHQAFVDRLNEVNLEAVDGDQEGYLRELIDFLAGWLINHILKERKCIYG